MNYHIKVLGIFTQTQYNSPNEISCKTISGASTEITYWAVPNCVGTNDFVNTLFDNKVTNRDYGEVGSGHSIKYGDVVQEFYCSVGSGDLRQNATITGTLGSLSDSTVAACPSNTDLYVSGRKVFLRGLGVKTVTDACPACCNDWDHLDNYTSSTACSGIGNLANALTVILY